MKTTDVLICGCGPTGAMLSSYLSRMGVRNVVLEKEPDITTDPRGIALDDDGVRAVQGLGLYDKIFTDIGAPIGSLQFISGSHHDFQARPFLSFDTSVTAGDKGHISVISHEQPKLEKHLRSCISRNTFSELRSGCTLTSIREDEEWVHVTCVDDAGLTHGFRSKFFVGADGKTGFTRKKYLEPKGIRMEFAERTKYQETWVALNWKIRPPTRATHPDFPLWALGYSPDDVFDLFFPPDFRFLCNPDRPTVCGRFGLPEDRLWRLEYVVRHGEDPMVMAGPDKVKEVVFPYLKHPGSRYGLPEHVEFPEDCIEVLRCRPFQFSARSCDRWALGRVILCGDAAHVFPPFGGQGIASGFRDALSLSWRLALLSRSSSMDADNLLRGWYTERKQQLEKSLASTVRNGDMVNGRNPIKNFIRDWGLWAFQLVPSWKAWIELGPVREGMPKYSYDEGMPFVAELGGGVCFPQTYCVALSSGMQSPQVRFTDDVVFAEGKKKLFQIAVLLGHPGEAEDAMHDLDGLDEISHELSPAEATFFVPRQSVLSAGNEQGTSGAGLFRTASGEEFAASDLCVSRPAPRGYVEDAMYRCANRKRYVILRFDRFVFAACKGRQELELAASRLSQLFPASSTL